jgi:hypothetical protein
MNSPPPTPPNITGDEWYWRHKEAFEYLDWKGKHLELPKTAIAASIDEAEEDVEKAEQDVADAQYYADHPHRGSPEMFAERNRELAMAKWVLALMQLRLAKTKVAKLKEKPERYANLADKKEGPSAFFPSITVKSGGRLKTRRTKKRNGSTRVRKHKTRHLSQRQKS